jgi:S-DNA-T family DNA segregation ATPase FtsK/SpoIIIE
MAYQAKQRDPIFDSNTQAVIERRGKELMGLGLIALGVILAVILASYSPEDPGWMSATDTAAQNALGRLGAFIASPLSVIAGLGAWALSFLLIVWGARLTFHFGQERVFGRLVFAPIAVAMCSIYASTLVPSAGWTHSFGLGGLFGDTILGAMLAALPFNAGIGLKIMSVLSAVAAIAVVGFVAGVSLAELKRFGHFLMLGVVMTYGTIVSLLGKGAKGAAIGAVATAHHMKTRQTARLEEKQSQPRADDVLEEEFMAPPPLRTTRVLRPDMPIVAAPQVQAATDEVSEPLPMAEPEAPSAKPGLLGSIFRRTPDPEPELVEQPSFDGELPEEAGGEDRIRAKIASALKNRTHNVTLADPSRAEPPLARAVARHRRSPDPMILETNAPHIPAPSVQPEPAYEDQYDPAYYAPEAVAPEAIAPDHGYREEPAMMAQEPNIVESVMPSLDKLHENPLGYDDKPAPRNAPLYRGSALAENAPSADAPAQPAPEMEAEAPAEIPAMAPSGMDAHMDAAEESDLVVENLMDPDIDTTPQVYTPSHAGLAQPAKAVVHHNFKKPAPTSERAKAEAQPSLSFEDTHPGYELPPLSLLANPVSVERHHLSDEALEENARMLETVLDDYGIKGEIVSVRPGPVVTMYELEPAPGLKASRVIGLADDIARSMSALSARVSTVPGRSVIGIELPNEKREMVSFREILSTRDFGDGKHGLPLALGKDIGGDPIVANLAKMPHLLIAGTTGSGKSVAINTMIMSLLYRLTPEDCRMIMIDPKMLELSVYDGIPHLLSPVVTDPKKAVVALKWVVGEMEDRYRKMSKMGVRNIEGYNGRVADSLAKGELFERTVQTGFDDETGEPIFESDEFKPVKLPYIVVIVDEMADLMMVAGKEIEACIQRLAQMARASGIHLIMATQRPSVDVITGTIKANFPTRISFQVTSKIDSRTILGEQGAEQLLGMGDMLYMAGGSRVTRVHGPFVSDEEVEEIVTYLKSFGAPEYIGGVVEGPSDEKAGNIDAVLGLNTGGNTNGEDALYDQAVAIVIKDRKCSTSYIQRKLGIGYNKAAKLVEQMEDEGLVSASNHVGKREILIPEQ